jgi:uncharacterized protein (TIGR00251 family)
MKYLKKTERGWVLNIYVSPNATKTEIIGTHGDRLKIKIHSPPTDGKANAELLLFLKNLLGIKQQDLHLLRGETSKQKDILITIQSEDVLNKIKNYT